jgi:hypothetical protein
LTFVNRLAQVTPSQGTPVANDSVFLHNTFTLGGTGSATKTMSWATTVGVPTISKGKIRAKLSAQNGTSPTLILLEFVLDDGTNFVSVGRFNPTTAQPLNVGTGSASATSPNYIDHVFEFETDIAATELSIVTTLGGTTPTATLDVELAGTT